MEKGKNTRGSQWCLKPDTWLRSRRQDKEYLGTRGSWGTLPSMGESSRKLCGKDLALCRRSRGEVGYALHA